MKDEARAKIPLQVPEVTGEEAENYSDLVESLAEKYSINDTDLDAMFNAFVALYIRNRMIYGDDGPTVCGAAGSPSKGCC